MSLPSQISNQSAYDAYVIARSEEEAERLRVQSQLLEGPTGHVLNAVGLAAGMSCLDVGCGPGHVMKMLGERVGPNGRVTGLDIDGELGRRAADLLNSTETCSFAFIEGDIFQADTIPDNSYSLTFARLVLIHLHDPVAALRRMWEWTRPGGYLAVIDYDLSTISSFPEVRAVTEVKRLGEGVFAKVGPDGGIGSKLPHYFEAVGIGAPDGARAEVLIKSVSEVQGYIRATYQSFLPAALKLGVATPEQGAEFFADLGAAAARGSFYVCSPLVVGVWKQKPLA